MEKKEMKKKCKGCRALLGGTCTLGYKIERIFNTSYPQYKPLESCPKPTTYSDYLYLRSLTITTP